MYASMRSVAGRCEVRGSVSPVRSAACRSGIAARAGASVPRKGISQSAAISNVLRRPDHLWCQQVAQRPQARRLCNWQALQATASGLKALIFDCDGVILESEELHRRAYNAAFQHFDIRSNGVGEVDQWSVDFYDMLQNRVGGGKAKMRWYFGSEGWPSSTVVKGVPSTDAEQTTLIDVMQEWKSAHYQELVGSGEVMTRPGVLRLFEEARAAGLKLAVCSAGTKGSIVLVLRNLLGEERFQALDVFLAGDDVPVKKPDPTIYRMAAETLGLDPADCLVIEDSSIGCQAATGAGMRCIITWTLNTKSATFEGAERIVESLDGTAGVSGPVTISELLETPPPDAQTSDDRLLLSTMEV